MIDELDGFIITSIFEAYKKKGEVNNWDMAKDYAQKINEKDVDKVYRRVKARLMKYVFDGIFFVEKNGEGKSIFHMHLNEISVIKHKFPDGWGKAILLRI